MSGTTTSSIFVARYAGDVFEGSRKNDLLIFTDRPFQQIMIGARPSPDGEESDFSKEALSISDSNINVSAVMNVNNEMNVNAPLSTTDTLTVKGPFTVESEMTMVNALNVGEANINDAIHVTSENGEETVFFASSGCNIRLNENTDIRGNLRVSSGSYDNESNPAFSVTNEDNVTIGAPLTAKSEAMFEGDVTVRDGVFRVTDSNVRVEARLESYDDVEVFGSGGSDLILGADGQRVAVNRPLNVGCNINVSGRATFSGSEFEIGPSGSSSPPAVHVDDNLIALRRDVSACNVEVLGSAHFKGDQIAFAPESADAFSTQEGPVFFADASNAVFNVVLNADSNARVTGALAVRDSDPDKEPRTVFSANSDEGVKCYRNVHVDGASFTVSKGEDQSGDTWPVFIAKDIGVDVFRSLFVDSNVEITDNLTAHSTLDVEGKSRFFDDVEVKGSTRLRNGVLTVDPTGQSIVFTADANKVQTSRVLEARCNVNVGGELEVVGGLEVKAGGTTAFEVTENDIISHRNALFESNVTVRSGDTKLEDGDFTIEYGESQAFKVTDAEVTVSRDTQVSGDTSVTGELRVEPAPSSSFEVRGASGDQQQQQQPPRLITSNLGWTVVRGDGVNIHECPHFTYRSDNNDEVVIRASEEGVNIFRDVAIKGGSNSFVVHADEGSSQVFRVQEGEILSDTPTFKVKSAEALFSQGRLRCAPSGNEDSGGTVLSVREDGVTVSRDLLCESNLTVSGKTDFEGELQIGDSSNLILIANEDEVQIRRDALLSGGETKITSALLEHAPSDGNAESPALSISDAGVDINRRVAVNQGCNLDIEGGGDLRVRGGGELIVSPNTEESVSPAFRVRDADILLTRDVHCSNLLTAFDVGDAFRITEEGAADAQRSVLLSADKDRVLINRDTDVHSNLFVAGDVDIKGTVTSDKFSVENDIDVGGDSILQGDLRVYPNTSNEEVMLAVAQSGVDVKGGFEVGQDLDVVEGRVRFHRGEFIVMDGAGSMVPLFSVLAQGREQNEMNSGVNCRANAHLSCNLDVRHDAEVKGTLTVNTVQTFDGSSMERALFADNDKVEINRKLTVTDDVNVISGHFRVRNENDEYLFRVTDSSIDIDRPLNIECNLEVQGDVIFSGDSVNLGRSQDGSNVLEIGPDLVTIRKDLDVRGDRTRIYSDDIELFGKMIVNPLQASLPVLDITDTRVDINRRTEVRGKVDIRGNARVDSNLSVGGNTDLFRPFTVRPAGSGTPAMLTVNDADGVSVNNANFRVSGGGNFRAEGNAEFVGGSQFHVETAPGGRAFSVGGSNLDIRRDVSVASNLSVGGGTSLTGQLTVGPNEDIALVVNESHVNVNRDLNVSGDLNVESADTVLHGDLRVQPGGFEVLHVHGDGVEMNRPLTLEGDASVTGNLTVTHLGTAALDVREDEVFVHRKLTASCNLLVRGDADVRGEFGVRPITGDPEAFSVTDERVLTYPNAIFEHDLTVKGSSVFEGDNLDVNINGFSAASVNDQRFKISRNLDVMSNLFVDSSANVKGDFTVEPGGLRVLHANGLQVDVERDMNVDGDITITGELNSMSDKRIKTNLRPLEGALDRVRKLRGYKYNRLDYGKGRGNESGKDKKKDRDFIGFIAQEVLEVVPEVVHLDENKTGLYSVCYPNMVALLAESVKQLANDNDDLRKRVSSLEKRSS